jgi:RNA polymerase sigma-70 factor (ECF subfamily)
MPVETAGGSSYAEFVDLVQRIEQGDESGMEHLYQLLSSGIRFFLMRRLQHPDVEDEVHEVFVDVVSAIQRLEIRDPSRLMGFVRTVIQRKLAKQIDHLVRSRGERAAYDDIQHVPDGKKTPEQIVAAKELDGLVSATLNELNPRDRELLVRFYLWEQTGEQICKEMSLSATQFRVFKSRAKARFGDLGRKTVMVPRTHRAPEPLHRLLRGSAHFPAHLAKASS